MGQLSAVSSQQTVLQRDAIIRVSLGCTSVKAQFVFSPALHEG